MGVKKIVLNVRNCSDSKPTFTVRSIFVNRCLESEHHENVDALTKRPAGDEILRRLATSPAALLFFFSRKKFRILLSNRRKNEPS